MSATPPDRFDILDARQSGSRTGGPSFSLKHRMLRAAWGVVWFLLASWTPPPFHRWRAFLLRLFGAKIAGNVRVYAATKIWYPPNLIMEENAVMGAGVVCYSMAEIRICRNAIVSQRAHLCAGMHDIDDPHFQLVAKPITIGEHAWIASEAFVGPGVTIAEGAVLGARGVAMKNLEPWSVYAGNPAGSSKSAGCLRGRGENGNPHAAVFLALVAGNQRPDVRQVERLFQAKDLASLDSRDKHGKDGECGSSPRFTFMSEDLVSSPNHSLVGLALSFPL